MTDSDECPDVGSAETTPESAAESETYLPIRLNSHEASAVADDTEVESELSEPDSNVNSPIVDPEDEIVVEAPKEQKPSPPADPARDDDDDAVMEDAAQDEATVSHYPKRKRTSLYNDLSETKIENSQATSAGKSPPPSARDTRKQRQSREAGAKPALLGYWRDSRVPEVQHKHAVVGFIDIRDRLRTRVQSHNMAGAAIGDYRLPPGPGASWVTFDRIVFADHLVGLDHAQIKEYVRLVSDLQQRNEEVNETELVKAAILRAKENPAYENSVVGSSIAHGAEQPQRLQPRPDPKRRKTNSGFAAINGSGLADASTPTPEPGAKSQTPPQPLSAHQTRFSIDPLPGTRPTRILLGYWRPSSEADAKDRHAVYGILGQNDMFRVKVVRETRDGRFVDGNFPLGAGALWIPYEEVEFEDHLKCLNRQEVKEYCRIRQYQLDNGETAADRVENETKAVYEAQTRVSSGIKPPSSATLPTFSASASVVGEPDQSMVRPGHGSHELRQSRRIEPRPDSRLVRHSINEGDVLRANHHRGGDAVERTNAMARREIARAEAAQVRADRHASHRERAAAAVADAASAAAAAAAAAPVASTNGKVLFHESDDVQRLNDLWERQETLRVKAGAEDAKFYDGVKYERKANGPFIGKLVSQGTIINIDGEDYVEYRVLTKPSFF